MIYLWKEPVDAICQQSLSVDMANSCRLGSVEIIIGGKNDCVDCIILFPAAVQ